MVDYRRCLRGRRRCDVFLLFLTFGTPPQFVVEPQQKKEAPHQPHTQQENEPEARLVRIAHSYLRRPKSNSSPQTAAITPQTSENSHNPTSPAVETSTRALIRVESQVCVCQVVNEASPARSTMV